MLKRKFSISLNSVPRNQQKTPPKTKTTFVQKSTDFIDSNCIYTTHSYVQYLTEFCKKLTNKTAGAQLSFRLKDTEP